MPKFLKYYKNPKGPLVSCLLQYEKFPKVPPLCQKLWNIHFFWTKIIEHYVETLRRAAFCSKQFQHLNNLWLKIVTSTINKILTFVQENKQYSFKLYRQNLVVLRIWGNPFLLLWFFHFARWTWKRITFKINSSISVNSHIQRCRKLLKRQNER